MRACDCNASLGNTGNPCTTIFDITHIPIAVPLKDSTGARNKITLSDTLDEAYFTARINDTDPTQRWYPLPGLKNVTDERGEPTLETFEDNSTAFIQQGVRTFNAFIVDGSPYLLGQMETFPCQDFGFYLIDISGNLIGSLGNGQDECDPTYLYPIKVDRQSFVPTFRKKTNTLSQGIMFKFNWDMTEQDRNLRMITASEAGYDLTLLTGLYNVCAVFSSITQTSFVVELRTMGGGTVINPTLVEGLVIGDFALYNETDSAAVSISTVTESNGVYTFTFPSQTLGDVLQLTPTKSGYDFTEVVEEDIQIPLT